MGIMKIDAIIEKGPDGMYSIRSEQHFGNNYFGGYGETVNQAKTDFSDSVDEAMADARAEGIEVPDIVSVSFKYDLPSFFNDFDFL